MVKDLSELKTFAAPPQQIKDVIQAVFILLGKKNSSWKDFLAAAKNPLPFLQRMARVDPSKITPRLLASLQEITSDPQFNRKELMKKSAAAGTLCEWVLRMEQLALDAGVKPTKAKKTQEFSPYEKVGLEEETKKRELTEFERDEIKAALTAKTEEFQNAEQDLRDAEPLWMAAKKAT